MALVEARAFYKVVTVDNAGVLDELLRLLEGLELSYCVIGGQGVNAYVEPLVSLDLHVVVASDGLPRLLKALPPSARVEDFPHSVNVTMPESQLRLQFQTDPRYMRFPSRSTVRDVLGVRMRVAAVEDVLAGKVWAASDDSRRPSKRQKDLADIARLIERFPDLRPNVPQALLDKLV